VPGELAHKGIAEPADLAVRFALGIEIRTTLTTTNVDYTKRKKLAFGFLAISAIERMEYLLTSSQRILEDLLEAQEFENAEIHGGVEAETALVGAERGVELHAISTVDLELALVVLPDDAELDDALRDADDREGLLVFGVLLEEGGVFESVGDFCEIVISGVASR